MAELKLRAETCADRRLSSGSEKELVNSESDALGAGRGTEVKMAPFDCKTDQIERFLTQFEKLARASRVPCDSWAIQLSGLLRDSAKQVYHQLSDESADDYEVLKAALLRRFQVTAETYRLRFRQAKKEQGETHDQFHHRVLHNLDKWLSMANVDPSDHKSVREELAKEVVMGSYRPDLTFHLEAHGAASLAEIAVAAERFDAAEQKRWKGRKEAERNEKPPIQPSNKDGTVSKTVTHPRNGGQTTGERPEAKRMSNSCFKCGKEGHISRDCPQRKVNDHASLNTLMGGDIHSLVTTRGMVNGQEYDIVLDSGCTYPAVIDSRMVAPEDRTGEMVAIEYNDRDIRKFPVAYIDIDCRYISGRIKAACFDNPKHPIILGCRHVICPDPEAHCAELHAITRAQAARKTTIPLSVASPVENTTPAELRKLQAEDNSLQRLRDSAVTGKTRVIGGEEVKVVVKRGILLRQVKGRDFERKQVIVPKEKRVEVMRLAHEGIFSAHHGVAATRERVTAEFYWPGVADDVQRYVRSCDICQRTATRAHVKPAPLGEVPVIDEPFKRVAMDLVGPIKPATERGHRYILTVVDYATRFAEATALKNMETETVAEALLEIWARIGIPEEVLTDQGRQFVSAVMSEVNRLLSIHHLTTTPYHPQCNGLVERFNGTLKTALKKLSDERPRDWDRYIPALLFAYREAPQSSLGFSPFELVYGRTVRGPMAVLRKLWTDEQVQGEVKTCYEYVTDLRQRLETISELARENLGEARTKQAQHYNKKAVVREFGVGDRVLLLLPTAHNKLQVRWRGPYSVTKKLSGLNYQVKLGNKEKTFHINLLKKYVERPASLLFAAVVNEEEEQDAASATQLPSCPMVQKETHRDVCVSSNLTAEQKQEVENLLATYKDVLTDKPGLTTLTEFSLTVTDNRPINLRPYTLPHAKLDAVKAELQEMLKLGIIEPAEGAYCSPIVMVKKKDGVTGFAWITDVLMQLPSSC
ncbi:uncharacterized protein LOC112558046 [Pomacea canaliculata]|uniref:uncharacterized protein LOC112558046 n=1 Tax=Pomacea canaliculata TaxID=400727 RepID=UPI000D72CD7D|nr:uncharacterized protein LOC112558046 [Pomacea canaliculata]